MRRGWIVGGIIVLITAGVGVAYWTRATRPVSVEVAEARRGRISASFSADGVIEGKAAEIAPQFPAPVKAVLVQVGQAVRAGQPLIRLDDAALAARVLEARAAVAASRSLFVQAETALALSRRQVAARVQQAAAQLAAAEAQLQQLLAGPRPQEVAQTRQRVNEAQTALAAAEQDLARIRQLYQQGAVARTEVDAAEARRDVAQAQYQAALEALSLISAGARAEERTQARAQVEVARAELAAANSARHEVDLRQAEVDAARAQVGRARAARAAAEAARAGATIAAPFDGVVSRVTVEVGEMGTPAIPVITVVDPTRLWVNVDLADEDAAKVYVSQQVTITLPSLPGRRLRGEVIEVAPQAWLQSQAALRTRVVPVKIALLDAAPELRPGLEVDVEGTKVMAASALIVPSDALVIREDHNAVFVARDGAVALRPVRVGYTTHALAEILEGLTEGDLVVVRGKDRLADGQRVRIASTVRF